MCTSSSLKFSKMARYDMTGIGINIREIPDDNGAMKLKVLGLILDGPAHSAGVRQVSSSCYTMPTLLSRYFYLHLRVPFNHNILYLS